MAMHIEAILSAEQAATDALAAMDIVAWEPLFAHLRTAEPEMAPARLVEALLARESSLEHWTQLAADAAYRCTRRPFESPSDDSEAFLIWLVAGVLASCAHDALTCIDARIVLLERIVPNDALTQVQTLASDVRRASPGSRDLAWTLLLLHRRASEARDHTAALEAACESERIYRGREENDDARDARRMVATSLLQLGRFDEAFAILDDVMTTDGPRFTWSTVSQSHALDTPRSRSLEEAATVAVWAQFVTPEWVRALGGIAQRFSDPALGEITHGESLWARFERALHAMANASKLPEEDLAVVMRQARERGLSRTEQCAYQLAVKRAALDPQPR